ncbi:MAG: pyruvate kinase [Proteobacteria bacterium]|nr:pyruvate kinase [Pseudomonadota bacterium]
MDNKFTKILVTTGPAIDSEDKIIEMINAGADAFRLNFSHGEQKDHAERVKWIRNAEIKVGKPIAILQDLQGPKIRLGEFDKPYIIEKGAVFSFDNKDELGNSFRCQLPHPEILSSLKVGDSLLINDGLLKMEVLETAENLIKCKALCSGEISSRKGLNLPGVDLPVTAMTDKDHADIRFALDTDLDVDWIALSFVQRPTDVTELREIVGDKYKIMAKIEMPQAVERIEEILDVVDGIMVARGDLGVEVDFAKVPIIQKSLIKQAQDKGKIAIVATQMLNSMVTSPTPTRAEVSDIANAAFDGADAVMLSNESAVGEYPVEAVEAMRNISLLSNQTPYFMSNKEFYFAQSSVDSLAIEDSITASAAIMAEQLDASALVCYTTSGSTAQRLSRQRPTTAIWGFTPNQRVARAMALSFGIQPRVVDYIESVDDLIPYACDKSIEFKAAEKDDKIIITFGYPIGQVGSTNTIKIATV